MGGGQSQVLYSVPVSEPGKNETAIYRNANMPDKILEEPTSGAKTMKDIFENAVERYSHCPLLGTRNPKTGQYEWKSYKACYDIAKNLGQSLLRNKLTTTSEEFIDIQQHHIIMQMVGVFSKNREEWLLLEYSNFLHNLTLVPLYDSLGEEALNHILSQTGIKTVFCSNDSLSTLLKLKDLVKLENVVSFDELATDVIESVKQRGLKLSFYKDLIKPSIEQVEVTTPTKHDIFTFSYTSGTTGLPKGALLSHQNIVGVIANAEVETSLSYNENDVYYSYLPLPHVLERLFVCIIIFFGARIGFFSGEIAKMKEDMEVLEPTIFVSVPRLYSRFYDQIKKAIDSVPGIQGFLAKKALQLKMENNEKDNSVTHELLDKIFFNKSKQALGGKVRMAATGGAPISGDVLKFLKCTLCTIILEGYGQTESTGATFGTAGEDPTTAIVGGISRNMEFKLIDIPEMSYTSKDVVNGKITPRGEICFRGVSVFPGYYKDMDKTNETVDSDRWLHSGDVGQLFPNGSLKIIDRKKNLFKLAQGEYIAPEKIENVYVTSKLLDEVFIHGDSLEAYIVCIAVPNHNQLIKMAQEQNIQGTFEELCENVQLKALVLKELEKIGKEAKLLGFEQARKLHLDPQPFTNRDIITTSFKIKRKEARDSYKQVIAELYK